MIYFFGEVAQAAQLTRIRLVTVDNIAFRIHYRLTFALLLACTSLVCGRQYLGEHILCTVDSDFSVHVVNTYCFFTPTYTLPNSDGSAYPGVGPVVRQSDKPVYHAYYQWVPFVLFGQAMLFLASHKIWRRYEGGTIGKLVIGLQRLYLKPDGDQDVETSSHFIPCEATRRTKARAVLNRLDLVTRFRLNRYWALVLIGCELLNLINVLGQLVLMDKFLGGQFYTYGLNFWLDGDKSFDRVFPKITKCDFRKYGPAGDIEDYDAMCVMSLNVVNEKIYVMLWFWFLAVLLPVSIAALVWRVLQYLLHSCYWFNRLLLLEVFPGDFIEAANLSAVAKRTSFSDWMFMYNLSCNIDSAVFSEMLHTFAASIGSAVLDSRSDDNDPTVQESAV